MHTGTLKSHKKHIVPCRLHRNSLSGNLALNPSRRHDIKQTRFQAGVAKLADALDSKSSEVKLIRVRVPSPVPLKLEFTRSSSSTPRNLFSGPAKDVFQIPVANTAHITKRARLLDSYVECAAVFSLPVTGPFGYRIAGVRIINIRKVLRHPFSASYTENKTGPEAENKLSRRVDIPG